MGRKGGSTFTKGKKAAERGSGASGSGPSGSGGPSSGSGGPDGAPSSSGASSGSTVVQTLAVVPTVVEAAKPVTSRVEATLALNKKISSFQAWCKENPKAPPAMELLPEFFSRSDVSALWMRLGKERASNLTLQQAWDGLKNLKNVGQKALKDTALLDWLTLPPGAWQERFMTTVDSLTRDKVK